MPEAAVHETSVGKIAAKQPAPRGAKADAVVVTPENFSEYVTTQLAPKGPEAERVAAAEAEAKKAAEEKEAEEKKAAKAPAKAEAQAEPAPEEIDHPDSGKKDKLNKRFSELTEKRRAAEAKAEAAAKAAAEERAAREAAERARDELRAKYEPPKPDNLGPEPQPEQFTDAREYGKALKDWTAENTLREEAGKRAKEQREREAEAQSKRWQEREEATKKELPDYTEKLSAAVNVKISDQARDAIVRAENGPRILYHLAEHPEVADALAKLTVGEMYMEIGRLSATLGGKPASAAVQKDEKPAPKAEISRAPEPISPLRNAAAPVVHLSGHQEVPKAWTYEDYKAARKAGQIK